MAEHASNIMHQAYRVFSKSFYPFKFLFVIMQYSEFIKIDLIEKYYFLTVKTIISNLSKINLTYSVKANQILVFIFRYK